MEFTAFKGKVMWSMVDANMHLRHSAYADFAAQARLELLDQLGFTASKFKEYQIGPILFREELIYLKEVPPNDDITMTCRLSKWNETKSFWSFTQELFRSDGVKAAIIHVDGAWLDLTKRKLAGLPEGLTQLFLQVERTEDFQLNA
jgi:acyl-CoA thioester hydrolase